MAYPGCAHSDFGIEGEQKCSLDRVGRVFPDAAGLPSGNSCCKPQRDAAASPRIVSTAIDDCSRVIGARTASKAAAATE
jgi:hypothetical protein